MTNLEIVLLSVCGVMYFLGQASAAFYVVSSCSEDKIYVKYLIVLFWLPIFIVVLVLFVAVDVMWPILRHWYNKVIGDYLACQKCTYNKERGEIVYKDKNGKEWYWEVDSRLGRQILKLNKRLRKEIYG